jgi:hypothetical protein
MCFYFEQYTPLKHQVQGTCSTQHVIVNQRNEFFHCNGQNGGQVLDIAFAWSSDLELEIIWLRRTYSLEVKVWPF